MRLFVTPLFRVSQPELTENPSLFINAIYASRNLLCFCQSFVCNFVRSILGNNIREQQHESRRDQRSHESVAGGKRPTEISSLNTQACRLLQCSMFFVFGI